MPRNPSFLGNVAASTLTTYSAQLDFDIEISHCSCSAIRGDCISSYIWCHIKKEDKFNDENSIS